MNEKCKDLGQGDFLWMCCIFFFFIFLLDLLFIYISNIVSFENPLSHSPSHCFDEGDTSPTPASPAWHSPTLGHQAFTGPSSSPPIDVQQGYPLLPMWLEPWVTPCVLFGGWLSSWKLWLVDIFVLPMRLQTPSAPTVLALTPPLESTCSVQCLAVYFRICIGQALAQPFRGQLYQAPVYPALLGISNSVWVWCQQMGWIPRWGSP